MGEFYLYDQIEKSIISKIDYEVESIMSRCTYNIYDNQILVDKLITRLIDEMIKISNNFKYIVNCIVFNNDSSFISEGVDCFINNSTDGLFNKTYIYEGIGVIVTMFILAL